MRIVQFIPKKQPDSPARLGTLIDGGRAVLDLPATLDGTGRSGWLPASTSGEWWNLTGSVWPLARSSTEVALGADKQSIIQWRKQGRVLDLADVQLRAPVPRPGKLICIGLNYRDHAIESGMAIPENPVVFSKFSTAVVGPGDPVVIPRHSAKPDYEAEMAVVIGRLAKNVAKADAYKYVFGYCSFNDVSARDFQFSDGQWQRGKSCDTFAPMGPYVATADEIKDPGNLAIAFRLNGETLQSSNTNQLIFDVPHLIEFLSASITLEPGDVIATGTPPGVGFARKPPVFLKPGDKMEVEVEGLGVLANPVVADNQK